MPRESGRRGLSLGLFLQHLAAPVQRPARLPHRPGRLLHHWSQQHPGRGRHLQQQRAIGRGPERAYEQARFAARHWSDPV